MRYLLLLHVEEAGFGQLAPTAQTAAMAAYADFTGALTASGALVSSGRLTPSAEGFTVRTKGGRAVAMDGPYAETKEQVGGYYLIEAADCAAALAWAERCPAAGHGSVEVREVMA